MDTQNQTFDIKKQGLQADMHLRSMQRWKKRKFRSLIEEPCDINGLVCQEEDKTSKQIGNKSKSRHVSQAKPRHRAACLQSSPDSVEIRDLPWPAEKAAHPKALVASAMHRSCPGASTMQVEVQ